jgi:soluble lytic murein transglycosylase-like protein
MNKHFTQRPYNINKHFTQRPYKKIKAQQKYHFLASSLLFLILVALMSLISQRVSDNTKQIESLINETKEIRVEQQEEIELLKPKTIQEKIIEMSIEYGVDTQTALDIAKCESQFGKYPKNWEGSSAKGIYQFIDSTWEERCSGDVLNEDDNIKCFMELYNKYPHYWDECNIIINNK